MVDKDAAIAIITTAASAITASVVAIIRELDRRKKRKALEKSSHSMFKIVHIYDALNSLASAVNADRCLVLYTSNGGGIPSPAAEVYVTILYEVVPGDGLIPIRPDFIGVPIDEAYAYMIRNVQDHQIAKWEYPMDGLRDGFLKDLYESEGVKYALVVPILQTPTKFYFLSIRWVGDSHKPNTHTTTSLVQRTANKIAAIMREDSGLP